MSDVAVRVAGQADSPNSISAQAAFLRDLAFTIEQEGGLSNDANDPGGVTNLGVTIASWSDWLNRSASPQDIAALTVDTVAPFYHARYWNALRAWNLPLGAALMVFDHGVNAGVYASAIILQRVVAARQTVYRVALDGMVGPITASAARSVPIASLLPALRTAQLSDYTSKADANYFLDGWTNRLTARYTAACQQTGVPTTS